jgi:hypothetical protein
MPELQLSIMALALVVIVAAAVCQRTRAHRQQRDRDELRTTLCARFPWAQTYTDLDHALREDSTTSAPRQHRQRRLAVSAAALVTATLLGVLAAGRTVNPAEISSPQADDPTASTTTTPVLTHSSSSRLPSPPPPATPPKPRPSPHSPAPAPPQPTPGTNTTPDGGSSGPATTEQPPGSKPSDEPEPTTDPEPEELDDKQDQARDDEPDDTPERPRPSWWKPGPSRPPVLGVLTGALDVLLS